MKANKFAILLATLALTLSCGACRAMDKNPKTPDIPSVTTPKKDKILDDKVIPKDNDGTPDVMPDVIPDVIPDVTPAK